KPVQAKRPTLLHRATKWSRRHSAVAMSTGLSTMLLLALLVVGLAVNNFLIRQEQRRTKAEQERAETALAKEGEERRRAQENMLLAYDALERVYLSVAEREFPRDPQREKEGKQLVQDMLQLFEQLAQLNHTDPSSRRAAGWARFRIGSLRYKLGQ